MGPIELLLLRGAWLTLPLSCGTGARARWPTAIIAGCNRARRARRLRLDGGNDRPAGSPSDRLDALRLVTTALPSTGVFVAIGVLAATVASASLPIVAVATVVGVAVLVLAQAPAVVDRCVDGASYGPERRLALRAPVCPLGWVHSLSPSPGFGLSVCSGPLLLAARQWLVGAALTVGRAGRCRARRPGRARPQPALAGVRSGGVGAP